jgi:nitrogen-specific signal transduction histidine kinase/CheY-like chemotaxis protein
LTRLDAPPPPAGLVEAFVGQASVALERRRAEEEKAEVEQQLLHAQKLEAVGTLAGGVAHDFNNLLTGILGRAEYLKLSSDPEGDVHKNAAVIEKAALRASELTGQLLGFARKGKVQNIPVDIGGLLDDVIAILSHSIDKRIQIEKTINTECPLTTGDPGQLQQVFMNLAVNARDAMPGGGRLSFAIDDLTVPGKTGRYLRVAIADSGPGIPEDVRQRMFEPFFTTKPQGQGTGMGLAVVYGIVENHSGWIEVESRPGAGATFTVFLPLTGDRPDFPTGESSPDETHERGRILVVDDEEMVSDVTRLMLTSRGYQVTCLADGRQAVEHYRNHHHDYDLVLLDMIMPVMDGEECFRILRQINPDIRILVMTGHSEEHTVRRLAKEGSLQFIRKPFERTVLIQAVKRVLEDEEITSADS